MVKREGGEEEVEVTVLQPSGDDNRGPLRLDISGAQAIVIVEAA